MKMPEDIGNKITPAHADLEKGHGLDHVIKDPLNFSDESIRTDFIKKVYSGFSLNVLLALVMVIICLLVEPIGVFFRANLWAFFALFAFCMAIALCMDYCSNFRKKFPANYIFTFIFVIGYGFLTAGHPDWKMSSIYSVVAVLVIGIPLTIFACSDKSPDLTSVMFRIRFNRCGYLIYIFIIIGIFTSSLIPWILFVLFCFFYFSVYYFLYTQMVWGKKAFHFSGEDYVYGALILFLGICNMFLFFRLALIFGVLVAGGNGF